MKFQKKEFNVSLIKDEENYEQIDGVICNGKSLFNKIMLALSILFSIICTSIMVKELFSGNSINFFNILITLILIVLFTLPAIYFYMKIANFKLEISNSEITYTNIFKNSFNYYTNEIKNAKYYRSIGTGDSIALFMNDNKIIKVTSTDNNLDQLKMYLISQKILPY